MGDRGNIAIRQASVSDPLIYLYTHWRGYEVCETLASALVRGQSRWDDPAYLTRIIFDELTGGDRQTTGYGISLKIEDNQHPIPTVNIPNQTVTLDGRDYSFTEFIRAFGA